MTHVVVVGSGIAGLTAALHAERGGSRVTVVTKGALGDANTRVAQGGIAGVMFPDDHTERHVRDTLIAGAGLSDERAVRVLVEEGPARIRELIELGVAFDRRPDGALVQGLEAAHSFPRILHAGGDATGLAIQEALVAALRASAADVREHAFLADLVCGGGRVTGVELVSGNRPTAARERLDADAVILATGGAGELYAHSTNPALATADGVAAALRAGAAVADLEFVQFHPTVLATGGAFLVSEAVRGEGAVLRDETGRRFTLDDHPDGELAPRDVVARSIASAMARQDGRPVLLDATALGRDGFLARRFPTIDAAVRARGLDWNRELIPVTPGAHYLMGGVVTDLRGRTSLPGLYAAGEVARTGVHGANRLASNSLLEGAVFGARAGIDAAASGPVRHSPTVRASARLAAEVRPADDAPAFTRAALQQLMWEEVGVMRSAAGLTRALAVLTAWRASSRPAPTTVAAFEEENLLTVAAEVAASALARTGSVGAHHRSDVVAVLEGAA